MSRCIKIALAAVALAVLAGCGTAATCEPAPRVVPCPTEDSCALDYHDGAWHIGPAGSGDETP